jgi:hypothetical protein
VLGGNGGHLLLGLWDGRLRQEGDRHLARVPVRIRIVGKHFGQLRIGTDGHVYLEAKSVRNRLGQFPLHRGGLLRRCQDQVAAVDVRRDVAIAKFFGHCTERRHGDLVGRSQVDAAQQGDVCGHSTHPLLALLTSHS